MTTATIEAAPNRARARARDGGPAPTRIVVAYGFWIFILSDIVMFSALFAAYAVLSGNTAGGPTGAELFNLRNVFIDDHVSAGLELYMRARGALRRAAAARALPDLRCPHVRARRGLSFPRDLGICRHDSKGAGPSRSAFLSAFFTLVGMHGAHVTAGLIWLIYMVAQVIAKGLRAAVLRRLLCFSLFWHALDIVWIGVMTLVYLMGVQ